MPDRMDSSLAQGGQDARRELDLCVVVSTYKRPQLLRQALDALLAQTVRPREIVVVNDGADEATAAALRSYGDRVRVVTQPRGGIQSARNAGVRASTAAWIATLDDDDYWRPEFLETLEDALADRRVDLVFTNLRKFRGERAFGRTNFEMAPKGFWADVPGYGQGDVWTFIDKFPLGKILRFNPFYPSAMVIRRSLFDRLGGYDLKVAGNATEDIEFLVRALSAGRLAVVWCALLNYRVHDGNVSGGPRRQKIGRWRVFEFIDRWSDGVDPAFRSELRDDLPKRRRSIFDLAFQTGDLELLREVEPLVAPADWSRARRFKRAVGRMPSPLARNLPRLLSAPQSAMETLRHWSRVARGIKA